MLVWVCLITIISSNPGFFLNSNKTRKWFQFSKLVKIRLFKFSCNDSYRSSLPEVFCKDGVIRNFVKFAGKHLCQSFFFNKVAGLRPATLLKNILWLKKITLVQVFSCEFCEISKNTFSYRKPPVAASVVVIIRFDVDALRNVIDQVFTAYEIDTWNSYLVSNKDTRSLCHKVRSVVSVSRPISHCRIVHIY